MKEKTCARCGECCRNGGPALHRQDVECFGGEGGLAMEHVYAIRRGEMVYDQPSNSIRPLEGEVLKIASGQDTRWCRFYIPVGHQCAVYQRRPAECRALLCTDPGRLTAMYDKDRLTRRDLLPEDHPLLELLDEHDLRCDPAELARLAELVNDHADPDAVEALGAMLTYDRELRTLTAQRSGLPEAAMNLLFGRPAGLQLRAFGLKAEQRGTTMKLTKTPIIR